MPGCGSGTETRNSMCSGSVSNKPGVTHFEIVSKVHTWQPWLRPLTHLGSSIENIRREMLASAASKEQRNTA
jgi:hypothetical protein